MSDAKKKHRYKHAEGKRWIEVRVKNPLQLFDARDPAPFRERDLDDDFVEYVTSTLSEFSFSTPLKLVIYIEENETKEMSKGTICEAVREYLLYRIELQRAELKSFIKRAQLYLMIGLIVLVGCISIAQNLHLPNPLGAIGILREGIVIFGWVTIWKPIELILFDWYPMFEKLRYYRKLLEMEIDIRFGSQKSV